MARDAKSDMSQGRLTEPLPPAGDGGEGIGSEGAEGGRAGGEENGKSVTQDSKGKESGAGEEAKPGKSISGTAEKEFIFEVPLPQSVARGMRPTSSTNDFKKGFRWGAPEMSLMSPK